MKQSHVYLIVFVLAASHIFGLSQLDFASLEYSKFPLIHNGSVLFGRDFVNTYNYGYLFLNDILVPSYNPKTYYSFLQATYGPNFSTHSLSYPPHILPLIWPLGHMEYGWALATWTFAGIITLIASLYAVRFPRHSILLLIAPVIITCVLAGQTGLFTAALLIAGLGLRDRRPLVAGVLFGILTVKPQMGVLIPFLLLFERRWLVIVSASFSCLVLIGLSLMMVGAEAWEQYWHEVIPMQKTVLLQWQGIMLHMMPTAFINARLIGLDHYASLYQTITSGLTLVLFGFALKKKIEEKWLVVALLIATITITPYFFNYDMIALSIAAAFILASGAVNKKDEYVALVLVIFPSLMFMCFKLQLVLTPPIPISSITLLSLLAYCSFRPQNQSLPTATKV